MKITTITIALIAFIGMQNLAFAGNQSANTQATATVSAECTIQAQNLSFGALVLPLSAQSASTSMNVLCSKNASYTVGLAYGGVYGSGSGGTGGTPENLVLTGSPGTYNGQGQEIARTCNYVSSSDTSTVVTTTQAPSPGFTCGMNISYTPPAGYGYGKMIGVMSGDSIGYSIQVPNNAGEVWNAGQNSYTAIGTGSNQAIPVIGTLVPAQSSGNYPTPDSYMDTVTATVSF